MLMGAFRLSPGCINAVLLFCGLQDSLMHSVHDRFVGKTQRLYWWIQLLYFNSFFLEHWSETEPGSVLKLKAEPNWLEFPQKGQYTPKSLVQTASELWKRLFVIQPRGGGLCWPILVTFQNQPHLLSASVGQVWKWAELLRQLWV